MSGWSSSRGHFNHFQLYWCWCNQHQVHYSGCNEKILQTRLVLHVEVISSFSHLMCFLCCFFYSCWFRQAVLNRYPLICERRNRLSATRVLQNDLVASRTERKLIETLRQSTLNMKYDGRSGCCCYWADWETESELKILCLLLYPRPWPVVGFVLTAQHCGARQAFQRQDWHVCHVRPVLFTEESCAEYAGRDDGIDSVGHLGDIRHRQVDPQALQPLRVLLGGQHPSSDCMQACEDHASYWEAIWVAGRNDTALVQTKASEKNTIFDLRTVVLCYFQHNSTISGLHQVQGCPEANEWCKCTSPLCCSAHYVVSFLIMYEWDVYHRLHAELKVSLIYLATVVGASFILCAYSTMWSVTMQFPWRNLKNKKKWIKFSVYRVRKSKGQNNSLTI